MVAEVVVVVVAVVGRGRSGGGVGFAIIIPASQWLVYRITIYIAARSLPYLEIIPPKNKTKAVVTKDRFTPTHHTPRK